MSRGNHLGQRLDNRIHPSTTAFHIRIDHLSGNQRHLFGLQIEVCEQPLIDSLHLHRPVLLTRIRLSLMEQYTTDNPVLLSLTSHFHQSAIRIVIVFLGHILQPARTVRDIIGTRIRVKQFDLATTHGHIDNTHALAFRQAVAERASEIVGRCQSCSHAHQWRHGLIPLPHLASRQIQRIRTLIPGIRFHRRRIEIHGSHRQKALRYILEILRLRTGIALHIRLSETEEDMEIRRRGSPLQTNRKSPLHTSPEGGGFSCAW